MIESPASSQAMICSRNSSHELTGPAFEMVAGSGGGSPEPVCGFAGLRVWLVLKFADVFANGFTIDAQDSGDVSVGMTAAVKCSDRL